MSKNMKHTPGPWKYCADEIYCEGDKKLLASVWHNQYANIRLIVAAPEMLECLIICFKNICIDCGIMDFEGIDCNFKNCEKVNHLKILIEKATGMKIEEVIE